MYQFNQKKFLLFFTIITLSVTFSLLLVSAANQGEGLGQAGSGEQGILDKHEYYDIQLGKTIYVAKRIEDNSLDGFRIYRHKGEDTNLIYFIPNRTYEEAMAFKNNKPQEIIEILPCDSPEFTCGDICYVDEGEPEKEYQAGERAQYYETVLIGEIDEPESQCWMTDYYHGLDYSIKIGDEDYSSSLLRFDESNPWFFIQEYPFAGYYTCLTEEGNCEFPKEEDIEATLYYPGAAVPGYESGYNAEAGFIPPESPGLPYSYSIDKESKGVQGICPDSWRIPSYYDFLELRDLTGCMDYNYVSNFPIKPAPEFLNTPPPDPLCLEDFGLNFYPAMPPSGTGLCQEGNCFDMFYLSNLNPSNEYVIFIGRATIAHPYQHTQFYYNFVSVDYLDDKHAALPVRCMKNIGE